MTIDWEVATHESAALRRRVGEIDAQKGGLSQAEVEASLNAAYADFMRAAKLPLDVRVRFGDTNALLGRLAHTQLAHAQLADGALDLVFPEILLAHGQPNSGLVFVEKTFAAAMLIGQAIAWAPTIAGAFSLETGDNGHLPGVAFCSNNSTACLVPDPDFVGAGGYASNRRQCETAPVPWAARAPKAFWRGSTTGQRLASPPKDGEPDDWRWLQRLALCAAANRPDVADLCDIGVSAIVQIDEPNLARRIEVSGLMREQAGRERFQAHRYVVDVDGNSNAWAGLFLALLEGACVLKVASARGYRQWYYDRLAPWREYVPVQPDFSDFSERLRWVAAHDPHAEQIAERGRELARSITLPSAMTEGARGFIRWLAERPPV